MNAKTPLVLPAVLLLSAIESRALPNNLYSPHTLVAGDFNRDGKADLAVVNVTSNSVSVLLGNGNATFQIARDFAVGISPLSLTAADINVDGKLDLVVRNSTNLSVLLGNGDGTFQSQRTFATGFTQPKAIVAADFDGDGLPDVAAAGITSSMIVVVTNLVPSATSAPSFDSTASVYSGGKFRGRLLCVSGQKQVIECSTNFVNWVAVATNRTGASPFNFTNTTALLRAFYRARVVP